MFLKPTQFTYEELQAKRVFGARIREGHMVEGGTRLGQATGLGAFYNPGLWNILTSESAHMKGEPSANGMPSSQAVTSNDALPRVIVFLEGSRPRVEKAVEMVRELYRNCRLVFVCEPSHGAWLSHGSGESVFVIEQPFRPFGGEASALYRNLQAGPIEACFVLATHSAFGSLRFRVFALRLRTSRFFLVSERPPRVSQPMSRFSFAALIAGALIPGLLRKIVRSIFVRDLSLPSFLDQPLAVALARLARILMLLPHSRHQGGREIIHVVDSIGMGGMQRQVLLLLKNRSPAYNHRVVVMYSDDPFFAPELTECGVPVYYLDSPIVPDSLAGSPRTRRILSLLRPLLNFLDPSLPFCREIIKLTLFLRALEPRPDIVHCWLLYANVAGSIAARLAGVPFVVTSVRNIHSEVEYNYYDPRWQATLERATVPLANVITANASAVALDYRNFTGAGADKVVTVPNGIDTEAFHLLTAKERMEKRRALGLTPDSLVVGTVARLAKEKDFETFLRAVALAREKLVSLRCLIVGAGPLRADLEAFAVSLRVSDIVQFLGERKDVGDLIQCYDVFLLASFIEGMPNAVMESQLLGVPVVATRAGGTVDLIQDGETGLLAAVGDHQELATSLVRMFTDDGLRDRISRAASHQIRSNYNVARFVVRTEAVYSALVNAKADRSSVYVRNSRHN